MNVLSTHADNNALLVVSRISSNSGLTKEEDENIERGRHPSTPPSSVSFSNTSDMMIFPREALDRSKIWYKSKDMNEQFVYSVLCTRAQQILIDLSHMLT